jgi:hypothetical protein
VGNSCRRVLQFVADEVFPPKEEPYLMKDGKTELKVGKNEFINRLCAFVDGKANGTERRFLVAESNYLGDYLAGVVELAQKVEHSKNVEKLDANMVAIHTYLIVSEILRLKK